jgi:hypothetical protein
MRLLCLVLLIIFLGSCKKPSPFVSSLSTSDSLIIQFYSEKEVLDNAATTTDKTAINHLIQLVDSGETDSLSCPKGGSLIFFAAKKEIQRIIYKPSCRQFEYYFNGKKHFSSMSDQAVKFFDEIAKGER